MNARFLIATAAVLVARSAQAVTYTSKPKTPITSAHLIDGFEAPVAGIVLGGSYTIDALSIPGVRAAPFLDTTNYFATPATGSTVLPGAATIDLSGYVATHGAFRTLSFYWGSIDAYNGLTLGGTGLTGKTVFSGNDINNPANGDQTAPATNRRVTFTFAPGEKLTGLSLTSGSRAFEIDNIAGNVPEPATWAMLLAGFGLVGGAMRVRSRSVAA